MIQLLITSFLLVCFFFCFIVYCALANKKPTPSPADNCDAVSHPGKNYTVSKSAHDHEADPLTCPIYLGTVR